MNTLADWIMVGLSTAGNGGMLWIGAGFILLLNKSWRPAGWYLLLGIFIAGIAQELLKNLFQVPRPVYADPSVLLVEMPTSYSFPSGHTLVAFSSAGILYALMPRVGIFALLLACLIAISRVYLGVHFVSDVLGGIVFGLGITGLVLWFQRRLSQSKAKSLNHMS
ncbi:phosphatase PAP2 family protein [Ammoniphilus sp. 3BR4]|uniref:phosphatase PAP2 family protein n=1 Tax=Ammoniphilus sp. 3BR4 TaxID=3158265 RepID=UPI0034674B56